MRILIVEDNEKVAALIAKRLRENLFVVDPVKNIDEAMGGNRPTAAALLAGAAAAKGVTLGLALRSRRDGWEGSRYRAPTAVEQGREGADRRRDADAGSRGERGRATAQRGAEPALHMAKAGSHRGSHARRLDFASR